MKRQNIIAATLIALCTLASCTDKKATEAQRLLDEAQKQYAAGAYERTLTLIDSLRSAFPEAIEQRKTALTLFQDASEKLAQQQAEATDKLLHEAENLLATLKNTVEEHKRSGSATAEELTELTLLKIRKDSLQARFDTQCATVKFIREKRKTAR